VASIAIDARFLPALGEEHEGRVPGDDIETAELLAGREDVAVFDPTIPQIIELRVERRETDGAWVDVDADAFASAARDRHENDPGSGAHIESADFIGELPSHEKLGHVERILTDVDAEPEGLVQWINDQSEARRSDGAEARSQAAGRGRHEQVFTRPRAYRGLTNETSPLVMRQIRAHDESTEDQALPW
jgi:hypothetical protein